MAIIDANGARGSSAQDYTVRFAADIDAGIGPGTDFAPETPQAQLAGTLGASHAQLDVAIVRGYNANNVNTASGRELENLTAWLGIYRLQPAPSTATVTLTGASGTVVPSGTRIRSTNGDFFATDAEITLSGTTGDATVTAVETGPVRVAAGTLTALATSVQGITAVTNATAGVQGRNLETDQQLRNRYYDILAFNALGSAAALQAAVLDVPGVTFCVVRDNPTANAVTVQGVSIPDHSFVAVVEGGADLAVGEAIAQRKPMGIASSGSTTQSVTHLGGFAESIRFERIQTVAVKFTIALSTTVDYEGVLTARIKQALVDFVARLRPGEDIDIQRAQATILALSDTGFSVNTFTLSDTNDDPLPATNLNRRLTLSIGDIDLTTI